jgi:hypothetical protein
VSFAVSVMRTDDRGYSGQGIIVKKKFSGFSQFAL